MLTFLKRFAAASAYFGYNAVVTRIPVYSIRRAYLSAVLNIRIGKRVAIHMGCFVTGRNISIGDHTVINRRCHLDGRAGLAIGSNVSVSPECYLVSLGHDPHSPGFAAKAGPVSIGDRAWLGARAMILPGVSLGEGCVVGAGSVVTKPAEPFAIVAGNPARKIGERSRDLRYTLRYFPPFNTDISL
jgi:acetyltransferase-like isoleucine patch superfamily enzyme